MGINPLARFTGRLVKWSIAAFTLMTAAMLVWTFAWPDPDLGAIAPADAIICLGGGMDTRDVLAAPTKTRVERCVQLHAAGLAPIVIFTGGPARAGGPSAGTQMARYAETLGLPADHAILEGRAQSTLQNALFSLEIMPDAAHFILVTEAFHLPRSWVSFHWARMELGLPDTSFALVKSENVRRDARTGRAKWNILIRESLAIWFNAARALAFSLIPPATVDWLR